MTKPGDLLTEKEILVLKLMCEEKSTKEVASDMGLSPRSIEAIRDKIKEKTGKKSIAGLIMYALSMGYDKKVRSASLN